MRNTLIVSTHSATIYWGLNVFYTLGEVLGIRKYITWHSCPQRTQVCINHPSHSNSLLLADTVLLAKILSLAFRERQVDLEGLILVSGMAVLCSWSGEGWRDFFSLSQEWQTVFTLNQCSTRPGAQWVLTTHEFVLCCAVLSHSSCLTLCDPVGCSLPGSSVHGDSQERIPEWVAMPSSRGSSQPRDQTQVSHIVGGFLTVVWATRETQEYWSG